jgi:dTDP-glucose 4,6-dehydratase
MGEMSSIGRPSRRLVSGIEASGGNDGGKNYSRRQEEKMRILITGGAGFVGSHLTDNMLGEGHEVVAMDNLVTGNIQNIARHRDNPRFSFIHHDVSEHIHVTGELDWILHFASPASPIDYLKLPIQTLKVGSLGTHNALGLAKAKGAQFMLASTSEVYGDPLVPSATGELLG